MTKGKLHVSACCPCQVKSETRDVIADTWVSEIISLDEAKSNANQIALAWNLLPEAERVLQMAISDYERDNPTIAKNPNLGCEWYKQARAILTKATKGNPCNQSP